MSGTIAVFAAARWGGGELRIGHAQVAIAQHRQRPGRLLLGAWLAADAERAARLLGACAGVDVLGVDAAQPRERRQIAGVAARGRWALIDLEPLAAQAGMDLEAGVSAPAPPARHYSAFWLRVAAAAHPAESLPLEDWSRLPADVRHEIELEAYGR